MPINETNSLENLSAALNHFSDATGTRVTLEYIAFHNFNDSIDDAKQLVTFCKKVKAKINIIESKLNKMLVLDESDPTSISVKTVKTS